jgi:hypothetical protein
MGFSVQFFADSGCFLVSDKFSQLGSVCDSESVKFLEVSTMPSNDAESKFTYFLHYT